MQHSFSKRVAVAPQVMFRQVGDEAVLLNLAQNTYLGLDPVGTRMWTLLTTLDSIEAAHAALLAEYEVAGDQCAPILMNSSASFSLSN